MAEDVTDVKAAMMAAFEAFNAGDVQAMGYYHSSYTGFPGTGVFSLRERSTGSSSGSS